MFKKVLYCIFAVLLGILVYMFATISIISGYQMDKIKEAAMTKDVDFFLGLTSYYNPTPVYQSAQGDPMDIRIYEIYQEASDSTSSDVGYLFLIFDIDENIATKADKEDKSKIVFTAIGEDVSAQEKETNLYLSSYDSYNTIIPFPAFGKTEGFNYLFGQYDDNGELVKKANVTNITKIEFKDVDGESFYTIEQDFDLTALTKEKVLSYNCTGMTEEELKNFNNPKSEVWKQALILAIYVLIAVGLGFILFKKPKVSHATASEFTGSKENPYDILTESAKEERVTLTSDAPIEEKTATDEDSSKNVSSNDDTNNQDTKESTFLETTLDESENQDENDSSEDKKK